MWDILTLHRQGKSYRAIAKEQDISCNTVKKYVLNPELPAYKPLKVKPAKLEPYKTYTIEQIKAAKSLWYPALVLFCSYP